MASNLDAEHAIARAYAIVLRLAPTAESTSIPNSYALMLPGRKP